MRVIIILLLLISFSFTSFAQQDTIWYNNSWRESTKEQAEYYRIKTQKKDLYHLKDYFLNGTLQMEAYSSSKDDDVFEGNATWYNEDGSIIRTSAYEKNRLNGDYISYLNNNKYKATYYNDRPINGKVVSNSNYRSPIINVYKDSLHTKQYIYFTKTKNQIKSETHFDVSSKEYNYNPVLRKFYDAKGNVIGKMTFNKHDYDNGIIVNYYYSDYRDQISSIDYYKDSNLQYIDRFYTNGNIKIKNTFTNDVRTKTTYQKSGKEIAKLQFKNKEPFNGIDIEFHYRIDENKNEEIIEYKRYYTDGYLTKQEEFYPNGNLKHAKIYDIIDESTIQSEKFYDKNGNYLGDLIYENYRIKEGFKLSNHKREWFKNFKLIKNIKYYANSDTVFSKQDANKVTYYSKKQDILGHLEIDTSDYYFKPIKGQEFVYSYDHLSTINEYKDSKKIKTTDFNQNSDTKKNHKVVQFYNTDQYNTKSKEIKYFSNDKIKEETTFVDGYQKQISVFYDINGKQIAKYNHETETGTEYDYFFESDEVSKISTNENGILIAEKLYLELRGKKSDSKEKYGLFRDFDINTSDKFYNEEGSQIFNIEYKDKLPYNGVFYDYNRNQSITVKNGVSNGTYNKYNGYYFPEDIIETGEYINGKKEGVFSYYDSDKVIYKTVEYKNDLLDGETATFENGKKLTSIIYKNDAPYQGVIKNNYRETEERFENGKLIYSNKILEDNSKIEYNYFENYVQAIVYYPNSTNRKYSFNTDKKSNVLNGEIIRYNKKNKAMHKAVFDNGTLVEGKIWIKRDFVYSYNYSNVSYFEFSKDKNNTILKIFDKNLELIFEGKEKNDVENSIFDKVMNVSPNNITGQYLY
ncbi:hypothetical protein [Olleya sp. R77988]|uniref:hypothetical protein n=1 Tax=Olleya sp. R77988 TaxID=3093875 RepID=UPI0037C7E5A5